MKRQFILLTFLFASISLFAQRTGDATFYSNTGKKFYVVLNGIRQNTQAQTNVNISGLSEPYYSCRVIAEDKSFNLEKNIIVKTDTIITYRIIEKKGKYKMRFYSETSLGTAPVNADQVHVIYHDTDVPQNTGTFSNNTGNGTTNSGTNTNVSTNTTTTSTTTNQGENAGNAENINININLSENGMDANVNIQGTSTQGRNGSGTGTGGGNGNGTGPGNGTGQAVNGSSSTFTSTTTTSSSSTTTINGTTTHSEESTTVTNSNNNGVSTSFEETTSTSTDGNIYTDDDMTMTLNSGCGTSDEDLQNIRQQIENENFSDDKSEIAMRAAKEKCMTVEQIKTIGQEFDFSDDKMAFFKAAYLNCMNQYEYLQLAEEFDFDSDKKELEKFIISQ